MTFVDSQNGWVIGFGGTIMKYDVAVSSAEMDVPNREGPVYSLSHNYPNPFNLTTGFELRLKSVQRVSMVVYDILGRECHAVVNEEKQPGVYRVEWNGKNNQGEDVGSGIYFCRFRIGTWIDTRKVILLR